MTHNAILNEPELKTGMNILVGMTEGTGVHQGTYFFTRFSTYYIVDGDYVLSAVDDAFSKQMNGQKVGCLVEKVTEIRSNKEDAMQHATQLRLPGVPPNYQKMLEETDLVVHTGLAEQVITTEEESMVLLRLKVHQVIAGNARLEDGYVTIYSLDRLSFWGDEGQTGIVHLKRSINSRRIGEGSICPIGCLGCHKGGMRIMCKSRMIRMPDGQTSS